MSWRLQVRRLHSDFNGSATTIQINGERMPTHATLCLTRARSLGLVTGGGRRGGGKQATWTLTPLGLAWAQGNAKECRGFRKALVISIDKENP
jgi:hypothetical protein